MLPSTNTCLPLARYWPHVSACFPQTIMLCHSVLSCRLPSASVHISDVAIGNRPTARPVEVKRTSGSFPKLPIRITLLTDIQASRLWQIEFQHQEQNDLIASIILSQQRKFNPNFP